MNAYSTIKVRTEDNIGFVTLDRHESGNAINAQLVTEFVASLDQFESQGISVVVLQGNAQVFCNGADFPALLKPGVVTQSEHDPMPLYALWSRLSQGSFVSLAHVEGRANAGGLGFVSACDIVLAGESAEFGLSEMLFGLLPALVMPFLIRRVGFQRAQYMTLMTRPFSAKQALKWGLVDACEERSEVMLRKHLSRLRRLPLSGVARYKRYMANMNRLIDNSRDSAIAFNREVFSDEENIAAIRSFVEDGKLPWEEAAGRAEANFRR